MALDFRNQNTLCTSIFATTLVRLGLQTAILCPGSRCTPLTVAFSQQAALDCLSILDERSAAFFALGKAKQTGIPVVLVCTSGTAGANFYPAIIEAHYAHVPLLILTSDRPPELRHCHAGQTIDQLKLFGNYPNWQAELPLPEMSLAAAQYWRQMAMQAWLACHQPHRGVVHLNLPFREPLAPIQSLEIPALASGIDPGTFFAHCHPLSLVPPPSLVLPESPPENGVIIAGLAQPQAAGAYCAAIGAIAQQLQYPVLAAGLSPVRHWQACNPYLISTYEMILRNEQYRAQLRPQLVLQIGELPTSKILRQWLAQQQPKRWLIDPHPENFDPLHGPVRQIPTTVTQLQLPLEWSALRDRAHLEKWLTLEVQFKQQRDRDLAAIEHCFEGKIVWLLAQILPVQTPLMIANSMPVRDVAYFTPVSDRQIQPYFNRGANGIDGTLSTALGIAHRHRPTVLLTGDLAFFHDTNGLLQCPRLVGHLTIIVVNNNGGGIFEMLPIAAFDPPFTEFFVTPQSVNLAPLCAAYGVEYHAIATWSQLIALTEKLPRQGVRLLEIKTDRQTDQRQRQAILG